jgi:hypothetical protein
MKLPRFIRRTLFVVVTLVTLTSVLIAWVIYQRDWIRQRHEFIFRYAKPVHVAIPERLPECPWSLRIFGEQSCFYLAVRKEHMAEAKRLFPEAYVKEDSEAPQDIE